MTSNNQQVQEMTPNNAGRKSLSKKTLSKVFRRSIGYNATYNYPRQQICGFCFSMIPAIKELYEKKEDQIAALKRHLNFFLTAAYLSGFIFGTTCALEEENANYPDFQPETIDTMKLSLMGPLAGIGDSLWMGTLRIIATGITAAMCLQGNVLGPILFFLILNVPNLLCRYFGFWGTYKTGTKILSDAESSGLLKKITYVCSIMGLMVVGGMIASNVNFSTIIQIAIEGSDPVMLQTYFDTILPKLLPLGLTGLMYWLLNKGVKVLPLLFGILAAGLGLATFGII